MKKETTLIIVSVLLVSVLLGWAIYDFYTLASQEAQYYEEAPPEEFNSPLTESGVNASTTSVEAAQNPGATPTQGASKK